MSNTVTITHEQSLQQTQEEITKKMCLQIEQLESSKKGIIVTDKWYSLLMCIAVEKELESKYLEETKKQLLEREEQLQQHIEQLQLSIKSYEGTYTFTIIK